MNSPLALPLQLYQCLCHVLLSVCNALSYVGYLQIYGDVIVYDDESGRQKSFNITIKYASQVNLQSLLEYMASGSSLDTPQEAIQAVDIVLRNALAFRQVRNEF
jgi:hypothetical protein